MALSSLRNYMSVLNKTQNPKNVNTFKVYHVCPNLKEMSSAKEYSSSTPINIIKQISEYNLKGVVEKREPVDFHFYLNYISDTKQSDLCIKWSAAVYNTVQDNYFHIGESIFHIKDAQQSTSERLCVQSDVLHSFLRNNQVIIAWTVEVTSSSETEDYQESQHENVMSEASVSNQTDFETRINTFFESFSNTKSVENMERYNVSLAKISETIDECQKRVLINKTGIEKIKSQVSDLEKQFKDMFNEKTSITPVKEDASLETIHLSNQPSDTDIKNENSKAQGEPCSSVRESTSRDKEYDRSRFVYDEIMSEIKLLLIGGPGNCKRIFSKSMLLKKAVKQCTWLAKNSMTYEQVEYKGKILKVVDGPSVDDKLTCDDEASAVLKENLSRSVSINLGGYHAYLIVVKYDDIIKEETLKTISFLWSVLGENFVKKYCVLVFTHEDQFKGDKSLREWLNDQNGDLVDLIRGCNNRMMLYDVDTKEDWKREGQLDSLLDMVQRLALENGRYVDERFSLVNLARKAFMLYLAMIIRRKSLERNISDCYTLLF